MSEDLSNNPVWLEFKASEGVRVQAVLASAGALPAACLVFGESAQAIAPGAPLYCAAIILLIGAYMQWMYTDATFFLSMLSRARSGVPEHAQWVEDANRAGDRFQAMSFVYGIASIFCTVGGLAAVYSNIRLPLSPEVGFLGALFLLGLVSADVVWGNLKRNSLVDRVPT